jgi:hypothetical protein
MTDVVKVATDDGAVRRLEKHRLPLAAPGPFEGRGNRRYAEFFMIMKE